MLISAQAASAVITKSLNPAVVALNGNSIATITVTNPNAALPLTNVQFRDTHAALAASPTSTRGRNQTASVVSLNCGDAGLEARPGMAGGGSRGDRSRASLRRRTLAETHA